MDLSIKVNSVVSVIKLKEKSNFFLILKNK